MDRIVGKSILRIFPSPGTDTLCPPSCGYIFVDCRPFFHIFERSKIHVLAEIFAVVKIFAKVFAGKNTYMPSLTLKDR